LEVTPEAVREIAKIALERKTGARALRSIIEDLMMDTMYTLPDQKNREHIVIDEHVVQKIKKSSAKV
jgi:ATP-dependent Clp protease ATP-binding subunit ClpX